MDTAIFKGSKERTTRIGDETDGRTDADLSLSLGEILNENEESEGNKRMMEGQIKALCEENEALRKGMHEILNTLNAKKGEEYVCRTPIHNFFHHFE